MARKRYTAEQIIGHLRQAEIRISEGKTVAEVVRELGVSEHDLPPSMCPHPDSGCGYIGGGRSVTANLADTLPLIIFVIRFIFVVTSWKRLFHPRKERSCKFLIQS